MKSAKLQTPPPIALGSRKARQYLAYEQQAARLNKENDV